MRSDHDWDDDDWDEHDRSDDARADDGWDDDEDDADTTIPCPACGASMFDDSPRCPACGEYVSAGGASGPRPTWVVLTVIICLALAAWWIVGGWL